MSCPVCECTEISGEFRGVSLDGVEGIFAQCAECGLVRRKVANIEHYHREINELIYDDELVNRWQLTMASYGWEHIWRRRFNFAFEGWYFPPGYRPKVLEIGCGIGLLIYAFRRFGCDVKGVELSEVNARFARERLGLDVFVGSVETAALEPGEFDLVILDNVLEHLPDPKATMRKVSELLTIGGRVYVDTPNFDALERAVAGRRWAMYEPDHIHLFTHHSLRRLLEESRLRTISVVSVEPKESMLQTMWAKGSSALRDLGVLGRVKDSIADGVGADYTGLESRSTQATSRNSSESRIELQAPPLPRVRDRLRYALLRYGGVLLTPLRRYQERSMRGLHLWALAEKYT
ncbi:MAG: class I SAM-dependent methyltransferase [candidate division KSB1 bacterium]|nr:class I SAM-dependent methyltransferase [candidate division KSB1 bacterium]